MYPRLGISKHKMEKKKGNKSNTQTGKTNPGQSGPGSLFQHSLLYGPHTSSLSVAMLASH